MEFGSFHSNSKIYLDESVYARLAKEGRNLEQPIHSVNSYSANGARGLLVSKDVTHIACLLRR